MGVSEVLLSEALSNVVFAFVAGSPLLILRVTGRQRSRIRKAFLFVSQPIVHLFLLNVHIRLVVAAVFLFVIVL